MKPEPIADPPLYAALVRLKRETDTLGGWANRAGLARNYFNGLRAGATPLRGKLEQLLSAIDLTLAEFEAKAGLYPVQTEVRGAGAVGEHELRTGWLGDRPLAALPLYGSALGGALGDENDFQLIELNLSDVLDYLRRPAALADDQESYALTIVGSSMSPRFKPGERVGVSPKARVEIGDDVIVQLRGENTNRVHRVLIKELVRRNGSHIVLLQHNPVRELTVERSSILAMHKVKGHVY